MPHYVRPRMENEIFDPSRPSDSNVTRDKPEDRDRATKKIYWKVFVKQDGIG